MSYYSGKKYRETNSEKVSKEVANAQLVACLGGGQIGGWPPTQEVANRSEGVVSQPLRRPWPPPQPPPERVAKAVAKRWPMLVGNIKRLKVFDISDNFF